MAIDILNLKPSVINRDLKGKYVLLYGKPKVGKTTLACEFPKNLLCGFEHGWNALSGVMAEDVFTWSDFKLILRQLQFPEAKEKFSTITIDTVALAWEACEQFICDRNKVDKIADIDWGAGYTQLAKEFSDSMRSITQMGYGIVFLTHADIKTKKAKDANGEEYSFQTISPALAKKPYAIINGMVDIIGYISSEFEADGTSERWLYTRETPTLVAGTRIKYFPPRIRFGYKEIVDAIGEATDKIVGLDGASASNQGDVIIAPSTRSYAEIRSEAGELWKNLVIDKAEKEPEVATANRELIMKKVEEIFGKRMKLSDIVESQKDLYELVVMEMRIIVRNS